MERQDFVLEQQGFVLEQEFRLGKGGVSFLLAWQGVVLEWVCFVMKLWGIVMKQLAFVVEWEDLISEWRCFVVELQGCVLECTKLIRD